MTRKKTCGRLLIQKYILILRQYFYMLYTSRKTHIVKANL